MVINDHINCLLLVIHGGSLVHGLTLWWEIKHGELGNPPKKHGAFDTSLVGQSSNYGRGNQTLNQLRQMAMNQYLWKYHLNSGLFTSILTQLWLGVHQRYQGFDPSPNIQTIFVDFTPFFATRLLVMPSYAPWSCGPFDDLTGTF